MSPHSLFLLSASDKAAFMLASDDDVIYQGTISRLHGSTATASRTDDPTHRASVSDKPRPRRHCRHRRHHQTTVPFEVRNKYVVLGSVRNWDKPTPRPFVIGFFGRAGRFHRRRGREGPEALMKRPSSVSIDHDEVEYHRSFRGMSHEQVRAEVLRLLVRKFGPFLGPGEI